MIELEKKKVFETRGCKGCKYSKEIILHLSVREHGISGKWTTSQDKTDICSIWGSCERYNRWTVLEKKEVNE